MRLNLHAMMLSVGFLLALDSASAASFDCAKARRPIEKLICNNPELDAADTRMGEVFKQVNAGFPLKGFFLATQRVFISDYPSCMSDGAGKVTAGAEAVRRCIAVVRERTADAPHPRLTRPDRLPLRRLALAGDFGPGGLGQQRHVCGLCGLAGGAGRVWCGPGRCVFALHRDDVGPGFGRH
jgi:hypothetical protein